MMVGAAKIWNSILAFGDLHIFMRGSSGVDWFFLVENLTGPTKLNQAKCVLCFILFRLVFQQFLSLTWPSSDYFPLYIFLPKSNL